MIAGEPEKKPRRRVKKVKGHAAHHGGAWKVAYADFVTAMMALFLVLWLVSQADTQVKQAIANYFRSPGVFDQQAGGIISGPRKVSKEPSPLTAKDDDQTLFNMATALKKKFESRPEFTKLKDQVRIEMTEQGVKIQILDKADKVSFDSGSAELTVDARAILNEIAKAVCELPNPLLIGGHTDRRLFPEGSTYTNWELSADRANAARRAMEASCVKPEHIRRIVGYADTEPLIPEDPYAMANRRISIVVMRLSVQPSPSEASENEKEQEQPPKSAATNAQQPAEHHVEPVPEKTGKAEAKPAPGVRNVAVGTPDKLPENVRRTVEPARPPAATPGH